MKRPRPRRTAVPPAARQNRLQKLRRVQTHKSSPIANVVASSFARLRRWKLIVADFHSLVHLPVEILHLGLCAANGLEHFGLVLGFVATMNGLERTGIAIVRFSVERVLRHRFA